MYKFFLTEEDKKVEILIAMEDSLLEASRLVCAYEFASDIKSRVFFMMNLWKDFYGEPHPKAKDFGI
jgi:hypothetical protein